MTTLAGKSAFPENHPLALGTAVPRPATLMVDATSCKNDRLRPRHGHQPHHLATSTPRMPAGVTLAHSTNCPEDLNKDYRVGYGAIGDSKLVLRQMIEEAKRQTGCGKGEET